MITYIVGELTYIDNNTIILEACGVGYEITVPESVIPSLPGIGRYIPIRMLRKMLLIYMVSLQWMTLRFLNS